MDAILQTKYGQMSPSYVVATNMDAGAVIQDG